jgi:hypothetical protein
MWDSIRNPLTGRLVKVTGRVGRYVIRRYLMELEKKQGGMQRLFKRLLPRQEEVSARGNIIESKRNADAACSPASLLAMGKDWTSNISLVTGEFRVFYNKILCVIFEILGNNKDIKTYDELHNKILGKHARKERQGKNPGAPHIRLLDISLPACVHKGDKNKFSSLVERFKILPKFVRGMPFLLERLKRMNKLNKRLYGVDRVDGVLEGTHPPDIGEAEDIETQKREFQEQIRELERKILDAQKSRLPRTPAPSITSTEHALRIEWLENKKKVIEGFGPPEDDAHAFDKITLLAIMSISYSGDTMEFQLEKQRIMWMMAEFLKPYRVDVAATAEAGAGVDTDADARADARADADDTEPDADADAALKTEVGKQLVGDVPGWEDQKKNRERELQEDVAAQEEANKGDISEKLANICFNIKKAIEIAELSPSDATVDGGSDIWKSMADFKAWDGKTGIEVAKELWEKVWSRSPMLQVALGMADEAASPSGVGRQRPAPESYTIFGPKK